MYKLLVIEDDIRIAEGLALYFKQWGFEVSSIKDFQAVLQEVMQQNPHLILLDIHLPYFNGFYWCEEIRKISKIPIVFLSAADDKMNMVMAMNLGADDFIAKPFDSSLLLAKVQALLRRTYSFAGQMHVIEAKNVFLNLNDGSVSYQDRKLDLTKNEWKILQVLMENVGKAISRDQLMILLWENDSFVDDNTLTVNVTRLRKKLAVLGVENYIQTKKNIGYIIEG